MWFEAPQILRTSTLRTVHFWAIMQHVVAILYRRFGTTYQSHFQVSGILDSRPLKMGLIGYPETSIRNYHYTLRNSPEEEVT